MHPTDTGLRVLKALIVERGFGVLKPGVEREVGVARFRMYRGKKGLNVYERVGGPRVHTTLEELEIVPAPPVLAEPRLTHYIMLKFPEPLHLSRRSEAEVEVCMPLDAAVVPPGSTRVIDVASTNGRVKFAVYGEIDRGVLTRHVVVRLGGSCELHEALVKIRFRILNEAIVNRVVFPAHFLSLCICDNRVIGSTLTVDIAGDVATIHPDSADVEGCKRAPQLVKAPLLERQRFVMLHGL